MPHVRAKFTVESITHHQFGGRTVKARAVGDTKPENSQFSKFTPSGTLEFNLSSDAPVAADAFEVGKSYFVDFTLAEA